MRSNHKTLRGRKDKGLARSSSKRTSSSKAMHGSEVPAEAHVLRKVFEVIDSVVNLLHKDVAMADTEQEELLALYALYVLDREVRGKIKKRFKLK